jgi:hypothetical protein
MYARLTTFRVKSDKFEEMRRWRDENQADIYAQPGLREWIGLMGPDGEVCVVAIFDDERAAREALPHARALWGKMAPMIEGEPTAKFLDVMAAMNLTTRATAAA